MAAHELRTWHFYRNKLIRLSRLLHRYTFNKLQILIHNYFNLTEIFDFAVDIDFVLDSPIFFLSFCISFCSERTVHLRWNSPTKIIVAVWKFKYKEHNGYYSFALTIHIDFISAVFIFPILCKALICFAAYYEFELIWYMPQMTLQFNNYAWEQPTVAWYFLQLNSLFIKFANHYWHQHP